MQSSAHHSSSSLRPVPSFKSADLDACCRAQVGKRQKKGMHSGKDAPLHHVNDVSLPGTGARAKQYLPFFQRGKVSGVVDFVITGHRLKVCPKLLCTAHTSERDKKKKKRRRKEDTAAQKSRICTAVCPSLCHQLSFQHCRASSVDAFVIIWLCLKVSIGYSLLAGQVVQGMPVAASISCELSACESGHT